MFLILEFEIYLETCLPAGRLEIEIWKFPADCGP